MDGDDDDDDDDAVTVDDVTISTGNCVGGYFSV